jgi:hypothetical protein
MVQPEDICAPTIGHPCPIKETHLEGNTYNSGVVDKITKWAYTRAAVYPSCSEDSFRRSVQRAINQVGVKKVLGVFDYAENAIQFLVDIKQV